MYQRTLSRIIRKFFKLWPERGQVIFRRYSSDGVKFLKENECYIEYLVNPVNRREIEDNIKRRKGIGNLQKIIELQSQLSTESNESKREIILQLLKEEVNNIPNKTHPVVLQYDTEPVKIRGTDFIRFSFKPKEFHELAQRMLLFRTENLTQLTGRRSYYFLGDLAELEHALIRFTLSKLNQKKFKIISVPDILPARTLNACGMNTSGERTQVFELEDVHGPNLCLSGTSEMALASLYSNKVIDVNHLPLCLASASRCYRAETSLLKEEKGIYRVHNFTKVEMFGISKPELSEELFSKFVEIQEEIFKSLGLDFRVLDMPMQELGASAYRKFDIEAWLPGREIYGEISSCSNCTDYQARRLNIKFSDEGEIFNAHTINATACAIPRTIMAIFENNQLSNGNIQIPDPLQKYFNGQKEIQKRVIIPPVKEVAKGFI